MDESERKQLFYEGRQGKFRYDPKATMTGWQAGLLVKFVAFAGNAGSDVESVFDEIYPDTQEHWEELP